MVGPVSHDDRVSFARKLQVGIAVFVGLSGGLITVQADAPPGMTVGSVLFGLVVGGVLAWYVVPTGPAPAERQRRERERERMDNPFEESDGADDEQRPSRARR